MNCIDFMDSYDVRPPNPNPAEFEYLQFLTNTADFRFQSDGPGANTSKRRSISSEMGQAFCRWFLHDHLGIPYFAHMQDVLDKESHPAFNGMKIIRSQTGDVPDYLCARSVNRPYIAEAKGRYSSIGFKTKEFQTWRSQFSRIQILDRNSRPVRLKGFIVGTRYATEENKSSLKSTIYAEDPETDGNTVIDDVSSSALALGIMAVHYSRPLLKIGQRLLSAALKDGFEIPNEIQFQMAPWTCLVPPFQGRQFIGGLYTPGLPTEQFIQMLMEQKLPSILDLSRPPRTFIGIDLHVIKKLAKAARGDWVALREIESLTLNAERPSQLNWLADGTVSAPEEFFRLGDPLLL